MKQMRLRYAGTCSACGVGLDAGVQAWWDKELKQVTCLGCMEGGTAGDAVATDPPSSAAPLPVGVEGSGSDLPPPQSGVDVEPVSVALPSPEPPPADPAEIDRGVAGASAREERARRSQRRVERISEKHPRTARLRLAITSDPTTTKVWDQGAVGEERVGARLEEARPQGIEVLHDRRMSRSKANIDHLVVSPNGVWVIDAKRYLKGRLERRDVGGFFKSDVRLYVGGRDKSALLDGVQKQVDRVVGTLAGTTFESVPVHGVLCFVDTELGWFAKPFKLRGVSVTWRKHLISPMLTDPTLSEASRLDLVKHLAEVFPPS